MVRAIRMYVYVLLFIIAGTPVLAQDITLRPAEICPGQSINLAELVTGFASTYEWSAGTQTLCNTQNCSVSPTSTTTYTLRYSSGGQTRTKNVVVTVFEDPDFSISSDITICSGDRVPLNVAMHNGYPSTIIEWTDNHGNSYANGDEATNAKSTNLYYTYTATVRNNVDCPAVSKSFTATVKIKPIRAEIKAVDQYTPKCQGIPFDLNSLVTFDVVDNYGNRAAAAITSGSIVWKNASSVTIPSMATPPADVNNMLFYADYSGATVSYTNSCSNFFDPNTDKGLFAVNVPVSSSTFYFPNYVAPCLDKPITATYVLEDKMGGLSTCDAIKSLEITAGKHPVSSYTYTINGQTATAWDVEFSPLTSIDDFITVTLTAESGITFTHTHNVALPSPPAPKGETPVCKGEDMTFYVVSNRCDTIKDIRFTGLEAHTYTKTQITPSEYQIVIQKFLTNSPDDELPFNFEIDYYSNYDKTTYTHTGTYTLHTRSEDPGYNVTVNDDQLFTAIPNLCLGDTLNYTFYAGACNVLTGVKFFVDNDQLSATSDWKFDFKPKNNGAYTMRAEISYRRLEDQQEQPDRYIVIPEWNVEVMDRPYIFMNNRNADTTAFCDTIPSDKIDLSIDGGNGKINYQYVVPGTAIFYDLGTYSFRPLGTGNHGVQVTYEKVCSEMPSDKIVRGELRIIRDMGGVSGELPDALEPFCVTNGIDFPNAPAEGTIWKWTYKDASNNDILMDFPYQIDPGTYTLTLTATNSCKANKIITTREAIVDNIPWVETLPDFSVCAGTTLTLPVAAGYIGDLSWNGYSSLPVEVTINETATFTATVTNACGNAHDDIIISRIPDAMVRTAGDTSACYGDIIPLNVTAHEGALLWYDTKMPEQPLSGQPPEVKIIKEELFKVVAFNDCGDNTAYLHVRSIALPFVEVVSDSSICYGDPFLSQVHRSIGDQLVWQPDPTPMVSVTEPVKFTVTASQRLWPQCGSYSDTLNLSVYPPLALQPVILPNYKRLEEYDLQFETLHAEPPVDYEMWGTLPPNVYFTPSGIRGTPVMRPDDYNTHEVGVAVVDAHGCKAVTTYALNPEWSAATAFTPLENSNNIFLPGFDVEIYTRNGTLIYKSNKEISGWDGKSNDRLVDAGTYFYKASAIVDGVIKQYTGYTTVMYR